VSLSFLWFHGAPVKQEIRNEGMKPKRHRNQGQWDVDIESKLKLDRDSDLPVCSLALKYD
jgi:hypothetical protein